jgi:uncharacterized metal-binding protein YceD (DUF177 family)
VDWKQIRESFKLRLSGIANGTHEYSIVCEKTFFENTNIPEMQNGQISVAIKMEKDSRFIRLFFQIQGEIEVICDRCLELLTLPLDIKDELLVKLVPLVKNTEPESENILVLDENVYDIDVFDFVRETILLSLPIQRIHPDLPNGDSSCNPEILKLLDKLSHKENRIPDALWDTLKNIQFKEN